MRYSKRAVELQERARKIDCELVKGYQRYPNGALVKYSNGTHMGYMITDLAGNPIEGVSPVNTYTLSIEEVEEILKEKFKEASLQW